MYCVVRNCKTTWMPNSTSKFHSFPKDLQRRSIWLSILSLKQKFYETAKICNLHFKHEDYNPVSGRLYKSAIPFYNPELCCCRSCKVLSEVTLPTAYGTPQLLLTLNPGGSTTSSSNSVQVPCEVTSPPGISILKSLLLDPQPCCKRRSSNCVQF